MKLYSIKDWGEIYETAETRKLVALRWVKVPNQHDGLTFRQVGTEEGAGDLFAAWILMVQMASKADRRHRGQLIRNNKPMTAREMALVTGFPEALFVRALEYFTQERVGWMVAENFKSNRQASPEAPGEAPGVPGSSPDVPVSSPENLPLNGRNGREGNGREKKEHGRVDSVTALQQTEPICSRMLAINALKGRRKGTRWNEKEWKAFLAAEIDQLTEEEWREQIEPLTSYYAATVQNLGAEGKDFRRRNLLTLLTYWAGEVDQAGDWQRDPTGKKRGGAGCGPAPDSFGDK